MCSRRRAARSCNLLTYAAGLCSGRRTARLCNLITYVAVAFPLLCVAVIVPLAVFFARSTGIDRSLSHSGSSHGAGPNVLVLPGLSRPGAVQRCIVEASLGVGL